VLFRLAYLGLTNALALLRLLPMSDRDKDAEILALRHQIAVLERHLHGERIGFTPADRALLAALLHRLPNDVLRRVRLPVRPGTLLRWRRNLIAHRHATVSRPQLRRQARLAVPGKVHVEHPVLLVQRRHLMAPHAAVRNPRVQKQDHHCAVTDVVVRQRNFVHLDRRYTRRLGGTDRWAQRRIGDRILCGRRVR
jgi:hypothetical protein